MSIYQITSVELAKEAERDRIHWQRANPKLLVRIDKLISSARMDPDSGIGHPEKLVGQLSGYWSRRITGKDRMIFRVEGNTLIVISLRFHYEK